MGDEVGGEIELAMKLNRGFRVGDNDEVGGGGESFSW